MTDTYVLLQFDEIDLVVSLAMMSLCFYFGQIVDSKRNKERLCEPLSFRGRIYNKRGIHD
jgi:hypothetical protein